MKPHIFASLAGVSGLATLMAAIGHDTYMVPPLILVTTLVASFGVLVYYIDFRIRHHLNLIAEELVEPAKEAGGDFLFEVRLIQRLLKHQYPVREAAIELEHVLHELVKKGVMNDNR